MIPRSVNKTNLHPDGVEYVVAQACWLPDQIYKSNVVGIDRALLTFSASDPRRDTPILKKNCMN